MKNIAIVVALFAALITLPAHAANGYIGLTAGQNKIDYSGSKSTNAFGLFGGYSFNEYIAAELAYVNFGSADTDIPGSSIKGSVASLVAVGSLPLSREFSLFAKLGYASSSAEATGGSSQAKSDITYGIGAQYNMEKVISFRVGYDNYKVFENDSKNSALMSVSALYKF